MANSVGGAAHASIVPLVFSVAVGMLIRIRPTRSEPVRLRRHLTTQTAEP